MPLHYTDDKATCVIELTVRGLLCEADYKTVLPEMAGMIERCGTVGIVEVVESFAGFLDGEAISIPVADAVMARISRVALVSDIGWVCPVLSAAPPSVTTSIRSFPLEAIEEARSWVRAGVNPCCPVRCDV